MIIFNVCCVQNLHLEVQWVYTNQYQTQQLESVPLGVVHLGYAWRLRQSALTLQGGLQLWQFIPLTVDGTTISDVQSNFDYHYQVTVAALLPSIRFTYWTHRFGLTGYFLEGNAGIARLASSGYAASPGTDATYANHTRYRLSGGGAIGIAQQLKGFSFLAFSLGYQYFGQAQLGERELANQPKGQINTRLSGVMLTLQLVHYF